MAELYTLPDGWEWKKLGNISKKIFAGGDKPEIVSEFKTDELNIPIYANAVKDNGLYGYSNIYKVDEECITISARGTIGFTVVRNEKFLPIVRLIVVIPNEQVLSKVLKYYLDYELVENTGSSIPQLTVPTVKELFFPLPPLEEQKRIVAKLDILFAKIDKAIALHQKNIDEANVFMASVLNDVFVELEEKYEKKQLNEIVIFGGKNISTLEYPNLIYFSLEDVEAQTGRILNYKTANEAGVKGTAVRFDENVVLYSKLRPYLNKVIVPNLEGCSTTELVVLKPKDKLDKYFLASYLRSSNIVNFLNNDSMGAKMPRTNMKTFRDLEISFPPIETQQKVVSYLDEISSKMEKIKQIQKEKMQSLKALKASILDQAFKGEL